MAQLLQSQQSEITLRQSVSSMTDRNFLNNRYVRKRASCDSVRPEQYAYHHHNNSSNPQKGAAKEQKSRTNSRRVDKDTRFYKQMPELSINLNGIEDASKKKVLLLNGYPKNQTHRVNANHNLYMGMDKSLSNIHNTLNMQKNFSELREEVEQLRMENESLREELKQMANSESELKYQAMKIEQRRSSDAQKHLQEKQSILKKLAAYERKIKELYEELIREKKKNIGIAVPLHAHGLSKKMVLCPSEGSINSSLGYYRQIEEEGEKDFFASFGKFEKYGNLNSAKGSQMGDMHLGSENSHYASKEAGTVKNGHTSLY